MRLASGPIIWFIMQMQKDESFTIARAAIDNQLLEKCEIKAASVQLSGDLVKSFYQTKEIRNAY